MHLFRRLLGVFLVSIAASVWRELREFETELGVLVKPGPGTVIEPEALNALVESVVAEFAACADEVDRMAYLETQDTMRGPAIVISDLDPNEARAVLDRLGARLAERGLGDARLTRMPSVDPDGPDGRDYRFITSWFALRGQRPPDWNGVLGWEMDRPTWEVTEADRSTMLDELLDWVLADTGRGTRCAVATGMRSVPLPLSAVAPMVRRAVGRRGAFRGASCRVRVSDGDHFRNLHIGIGYGAAAASTGTRRVASFDWRREVDSGRQLLAGASGWCAGGHLTRAHGTGRLSSRDADNGDRFIGNPWISADHDLPEWISQDRLVDMHGIMRLAPSLAAKLALGPPSWHTTTLPVDGSVLAEHVDLEGWFGAVPIADEVLLPARAAAREVLLDRSGERRYPQSR